MSAGKANAFLSSGTRLSAKAEGLACEIGKAGGRGRCWINFTALPLHPPLSQRVST